jgi:hypothetical protein
MVAFSAKVAQHLSLRLFGAIAADLSYTVPLAPLLVSAVEIDGEGGGA